jgi:hypothetical protein
MIFRMKKLFVLLLLLSSAASATPPLVDRFGLGFALGSPTAIVFKYWEDPSHAIDGGVGYWFGSYVDLYADYLWHFPKAFGSGRDASHFVPYLGVGGGFHIADQPVNNDNYHPYFGIVARFPIGVEWLAPKAPVGVFFELTPNILLIPGVAPGLGAVIGVHVYF